MSEDDKVDDRIEIRPNMPTAEGPRLGVICTKCQRHWDVGVVALTLREIKRATRHQCQATTDIQKTWPEVEPEPTLTDPNSMRKTIAEARRLNGKPA
jgi:hypothetical protein